MMAASRVTREVWHRYPTAAGVRLIDLKMFIDKCNEIGMPDSVRVRIATPGALEATYSKRDDGKDEPVEHPSVITTQPVEPDPPRELLEPF